MSSGYPNGDLCRFVDFSAELKCTLGASRIGDGESTNFAWYLPQALLEAFFASDREWSEGTLDAELEPASMSVGAYGSASR